ncbi:ATP-dependent helicase [Anaerotignum propionicum]|uniref:DNA 3'-5' helicase n=1 Tax=Anaerotignum propionicum DSM 1682 TaxID=991789 RepID=A0A0X8V9V6_ANAPI|nr:ATP-dependent helicase [Anaerotignum propionicum]AMJ40100.1 putative ATP-dependent DNA helicase YjcD [Anaerotignum propionicum DSM 1682]MEA5056256.1 ATP-dependent helicase [Anaerotignum propionicum]SHE80702.1 DNA helicase-2 / ATP-dependent DNA helicase PcrA [[Clostridium] propionicum DSM 1682] [Anaerotignum propionicum DSM 1682]
MSKLLNENQRIAVNHGEGPMLVLAGPGSGKTTVILCRLRRFLSENKNKGILVVTFTKAAATEMKERFGERGSDRILFATFHSLFFRILRRTYGYTSEKIIGEEEKSKVLQGILSEKNWSLNDPEEFISQFIMQASFMGNELLTPMEFIPEGMERDMFRQLHRAYESYKERHGKLDFDDMLIQCYELLMEDQKTLAFWQEKFPYIMVDEFQDINRVQYECLRLLAAPRNNLFVVGDDDQSIYGFRGSRPDFLLEFERQYPESQNVVLDINYRSSERILSLAGKVIDVNERRFGKELKGANGKGEKVSFFLAEDTTAEAEKVAEKIGSLLEDGIALNEIAVIYRTNLQGGAFARALYRRGIPYVMREGGGNIYDHWIAKDILAYLTLGESADADSALRRIINKPKRYISKEMLEDAEKMPYTLLRSFFVCPSLKKWQEESLENLQRDLIQIGKRNPYNGINYIRRVIGYDEYLEEYAAFRKSSGRAFLEIADEITEIAKKTMDVREFRGNLEEMSRQMQEQVREKNVINKGVTLSTMHGAKGLEFYAVFLPSLTEGVVPHERAMEGLEEERRLFYVALTRTKEKLCLSATRNRYGKETKPSRFLKEMGLDVDGLYIKKP